MAVDQERDNDGLEQGGSSEGQWEVADLGFFLKVYWQGLMAWMWGYRESESRMTQVIWLEHLVKAGPIS